MNARGAVIGLEIHVQLDTLTKLFCGDAVTHDAPPNSRVCPVCLGLPGALPVLNERAVELAVRAATLLQCTVHTSSRFVRKNYFYPDLPKGYQITQLDEPLATGGTLTFDTYAPGSATLRISRVHLEEDAGKLLHDRIPGSTAIDLNRCGIPLLEIVTDPDLHSAADAAAAARQIRQLLQYAGISECNMELGSLRIDANVSIGDATARTELKNLNSFAQLERAIDRELARQRSIADAGGHVTNATLTWDATKGELRVMRVKEARTEYRYFTEPDLPPLLISDALIQHALAGMPETPAVRAGRFRDVHGLPDSSAHALAATRQLADYFEAVISAGASPKAAAAWVLTQALAWCNTNGTDITGYTVPATGLADVIQRVEHGTLTRDGGRRVLSQLESRSQNIEAVIAALGVAAHTDAEAVDTMIDEVLQGHADLVTKYQAGDKNLFGFLMGTLMARAGAAVDPRAAADRLRSRLDR